MTNSEIYYLAGKCLVMEEHPEFRNEFIELCKNNSIDWLQFVAICSDNLILPTIYLKFRANGILELIPKELNEHLLEIYELNKKRNNEIIRQIKSINIILNGKNIVPLYLKGGGNLIDNIYSDVGERLMGDIDFLVPQKDYLSSAVLMLDAGYLNPMERTHLSIKNYRHHYPRIYHPDFISDVEIHRMPNEQKYDRWFNNDLINKEKRTVKSFGNCYIQSNKHRIIHIFIHDQLHHLGFLYGKVLLKDIYDLYLLSKQASLIDSLSQIRFRYRRKAIAYFAFARYVLGLNKEFFPKQNLKFWILKKRHDFNLNSNVFYQINQKFVLCHFLWGKITEAFYFREARKILMEEINRFFKELFSRGKNIPVKG